MYEQFLMYTTSTLMVLVLLGLVVMFFWIVIKELLE